MVWLITGSVAAKHWFNDFRNPKDIDLLTPASIKTSDSAECIVDAGWHSAAELIISKNKDKVFCEPNILYTLKVSHAEWDVHWEKTIFDVCFFKEKGCVLDEELYEALIPVWKEKHGKKKVNLNQTLDKFFTSYVDRTFDHEMLHELAAFNKRPMHEKFRPDLSKAWCSKEMFFALPLEQQYEAALEEIIVIAIERAKFTGPVSHISLLSATSHAYKKLVTTMCTGWFAKFLIMNRNELLKERKIKLLKKAEEVLKNLPQETK